MIIVNVRQDTKNIEAAEATTTRISKTLAGALLITVSIIAVVECSSAGAPLDGTQWNLIGWTLSTLSPTELEITAKLAKGQISGNSGVNTYGGPCKLGPGDAFSVGPLVSTERGGTETAMRAESAYLALLGQAKSYKISEAKLTLYDKGGNESLIFKAASK